MKELLLSPRDGLFCKDGRGWYTALAGRGHGLSWPRPSTVRGALRASWGKARLAEISVPEAEEKAFWLDQTAAVRLQGSVVLRMPVFAAEPSCAHRMWPCPNDALYTRDLDATDDNVSTKLVRLQPEAPRFAQWVSAARPSERQALAKLWQARPPQGKALGAPAWWTDAQFLSWLCLEDPELSPEEAGQHFDLKQQRARQSLSHRGQLHVGIDPKTYGYRDGALFAKEILETLQSVPSGDDGQSPDFFEWHMALRFSLPEVSVAAFPPDALKLGGRGHLSLVKEPSTDFFACPQTLKDAAEAKQCKGLRLVLVGPAHFGEAGWLPTGIEVDGERFLGRLPGLERDLVLRAAMVKRPDHVSGWDMARGQPKSTRRLVPSGSVYFFETADGQPLSADEIESLWLCQVGVDTDDGYGLAVAGLWQPNS